MVLGLQAGTVFPLRILPRASSREGSDPAPDVKSAQAVVHSQCRVNAAKPPPAPKSFQALASEQSARATARHFPPPDDDRARRIPDRRHPSSRLLAAPVSP